MAAPRGGGRGARFASTTCLGGTKGPTPFNKPFMTGKELWVHRPSSRRRPSRRRRRFHQKMQRLAHGADGRARSAPYQLVHLGVAEMAAIPAGIEAGDEVIMPSFTFVSTANAFVLRGAVPVFVDIRPDTLNIDESRIEEAITSRTKAIVPVHYAGVGCEMDTIMDIAHRYNLLVIEDAAQGIMSTYKGRPLGSIGHLSALSFHETKNIISGEGGALLINEPRFIERAEIIREKGTNRSQFFRGQVDKICGSILDRPTSRRDTMLFLWAQMEEADAITRRRLEIWGTYHHWLAPSERAGKVRRPVVPKDRTHNAHMYYLLMPDLEGALDLHQPTEAARNPGRCSTTFHCTRPRWESATAELRENSRTRQPSASGSFDFPCGWALRTACQR